MSMLERRIEACSRRLLQISHTPASTRNGTREQPVHTPSRRRAAHSFAYFWLHCVRIADGGGTKLEPWRWQVELAHRLPRIPRLITLKARQLGCSWLAAAYALWTALFQRGALVLLVSQTESDALDLLDKAVFIFEGLPEAWRPAGWKAQSRVLKFPEACSAVVALPSTRRAGRGKTARLVIADEHAFHAYAEANFAALQPTMDAGGQFWILSTANGVGNTFARLWSKSVQNAAPVQPVEGSFRGALRRARVPEEGWLPLFLPYSARPGRDQAWWGRRREAYLQEWMIHQEYPADPESAFVQTGRPVFSRDAVELQRGLARDPLGPEQWPDAFAEWRAEELRLFALPTPGHRYIAGADVAEGLATGDWSDLCVIDPRHGREVLSLHGHWPPDEFARRVDAVARFYPGIYGIERNNHGHTVLHVCRRLGTPGLFHQRPVLTAQGVVAKPGKPGWRTGADTKPGIIDALEQALREGTLQLSDALAVPELSVYQTRDDGSTGAPHGHHDDRVMARAIAWEMRKYVQPALERVEPGECAGTLAATKW